MPSGEELALPHVICGDFDSVRPEILNHFESLNVNVIHTPDQDETDLTKGELDVYLFRCRRSQCGALQAQKVFKMRR